MTNSLIGKAANLIRAGDIVGAEFALVSLAETEGDLALVAVLEEMPPKDLLAVIREYDSSKESVINLLVTPEQFARALVMEKLYGDQTHRHLRGMLNAILFRDDTQTADFISAIGAVDGGIDALVDYLSDRDEEVVHFATYGTFNVNHTERGGAIDGSETGDDYWQGHEEKSDEVDQSEILDHDWKEVTWLLKNDHPDLFKHIWPILKSRVANRLRLEAALEAEELRKLEQEDAQPDAVAEPKKGPDNSIEESAL